MRSSASRRLDCGRFLHDHVAVTFACASSEMRSAGPARSCTPTSVSPRFGGGMCDGCVQRCSAVSSAATTKVPGASRRLSTVDAHSVGARDSICARSCTRLRHSRHLNDPPRRRPSSLEPRGLSGIGLKHPKRRCRFHTVGAQAVATPRRLVSASRRARDRHIPAVPRRPEHLLRARFCPPRAPPWNPSCAHVRRSALRVRLISGRSRPASP